MTSDFQKELLRFGVVGVSVALFYIALYLGLLHVGVPQVLANALAFGSAIAVQYAGQARFTFRRPLREPGQALRFGVMTGLGFVTSAVITGILGPVMGVSEGVAALAVILWLPLQNYIFMKLWVFAGPISGQEMT